MTEDELVQALKALAHPTRLAILGWLREPGSFPPQDRPAEEVGVCLKHLQARAGVSQSTASQFLAVLHRAGLVTSNRIGPWTHYQRNEARIAEVAEAMTTRV